MAEWTTIFADSFDTDEITEEERRADRRVALNPNQGQGNRKPSTEPERELVTLADVLRDRR